MKRKQRTHQVWTKNTGRLAEGDILRQAETEPPNADSGDKIILKVLSEMYS